MFKNIRGFRGLLAALLLTGFALPSMAQNFVTEIPPASRGMVSGPEVGEQVPDFQAYDQNGNLVGLDDVMGPNGAMIVFHRSADW